MSVQIFAVGKVNSQRDIVIVPVAQDFADAFTLGEMDRTDNRPCDPLFYFSDTEAIFDYLHGYTGSRTILTPAQADAELDELREGLADEAYWRSGVW